MGRIRQPGPRASGWIIFVEPVAGSAGMSQCDTAGHVNFIVVHHGACPPASTCHRNLIAFAPHILGRIVDLNMCHGGFLGIVACHGPHHIDLVVPHHRLIVMNQRRSHAHLGPGYRGRIKLIDLAGFSSPDHIELIIHIDQRRFVASRGQTIGFQCLPLPIRISQNRG